jgi:hypothetical protein
MTRTNQSFSRPSGNFEAVRQQCNPRTHIDRIIERLSALEVPEMEYFENYMRHKFRVNHKARTIDSSFTSIMFFLNFYGRSGKSSLKSRWGRPSIVQYLSYLYIIAFLSTSYSNSL